MRKLSTFAVLFGLLFAACDSKPTARQLLSDEVGHLLLVFGEIDGRLYHRSNDTVTNIVAAAHTEKGPGFFSCPIHNVPYEIENDTVRWRNRHAYSNDVAVCCPVQHHGWYLVVRFNAKGIPAKERPQVNRTRQP